MNPRPEIPRGPFRRRAVRGAIVALALALTALSVGEYRAWSRERERLTSVLVDAGTAARSPGVLRDVSREPDRVRAALRAARGLLADELDRGWQSGFDPAELAAAEQRGLSKLEQAGAIAARGLARRPASWQAAEVLGATRYLEALRRRRPMTPELREAWSRPLVAARALGPGQPEPVRFLAAATLSEWPRLDGEEREAALELLRDAFSNPETFDLLATSWLRIAPSRSAAFATVPSEPRAWRTVERFFAERGDWGTLSLAHDRGNEALFEHLERQLESAEHRLRGRDRRRVRWYALEILEKAPPSKRYRRLVARALEILPAGPLGEVRARRMSRWLEWSRDQCLLGACPFATPTLARMAGLARLDRESTAAAAAEMAGDPLAGELQARSAQDLGAEWAPYHLLRARRLAGAGDREGAAASLARVDRSWHYRAAYVETRALLRSLDSEEAAPGGERERRLEWPADSWVGEKGLLLELYAASECRELELEMLGVSANGSAIEVHWNSDLAGTHPVSAGRPVRIDLTVSPDSLQRLEVLPFAHPQMRPGRVWLRDCAS